jgi:hypothetical protein
MFRNIVLYLCVLVVVVVAAEAAAVVIVGICISYF